MFFIQEIYFLGSRFLYFSQLLFFEYEMPTSVIAVLHFGGEKKKKAITL